MAANMSFGSFFDKAVGRGKHVRAAPPGVARGHPGVPGIYKKRKLSGN